MACTRASARPTDTPPIPHVGACGCGGSCADVLAGDVWWTRLVSPTADVSFRRAAANCRDHDIQKGVVEDGAPTTTTNAPGLDADGLPDDDTAIAACALGARVDGSQG